MNWNSLTIGQYEKVLKIERNKYLDFEYMLRVYAAIYNEDIEKLFDMDVDILNKDYISKIRFIFMPYDKTEVKSYYILKGVKYNVILNGNKMIAGQFIDYQNISKDKPDDFISLLSILMVPDGFTYNEGYDIEELKNIIRDNLLAKDAIALSTFFLTSFQELSKAILQYLKKKLKKMKIENNQNHQIIIQQQVELIEQMQEEMFHFGGVN